VLTVEEKSDFTAELEHLMISEKRGVQTDCLERFLECDMFLKVNYCKTDTSVFTNTLLNFLLTCLLTYTMVQDII
jgi:hypothetical protein